MQGNHKTVARIIDGNLKIRCAYTYCDRMCAMVHDHIVIAIGTRTALIKF
jgi:hypothetical protein